MAPQTIRVHALIDSLASGGAEMLLPELAAVASSAGIDLSVAYLKVGPGGVPGVERLRAEGVRHLVDTRSPAELPNGLRHFQRMLGFRICRVAVTAVS